MDIIKSIEYRLLRTANNLFFSNNEPSFFIIGAQKSGTSSLHYYLEQHPQISSGKTKEVGYFHRDVYFGKSYSEYKKDFTGFKSKIYFDSTPEYMYYPGVAKKIHTILPNAKIIILLREPIKRAYSAWNHYYQYFETGKYIQAIKNRPMLEGNLLFDAFFKDRIKFPSFLECIEIELSYIERNIGFEPALLRRGLYLSQIESYWKYFDKNQVIIIGFNDLIKDTIGTLNKTIEFLGVKYIEWDHLNLEPKNSRDYSEPMKEKDRYMLEKYFEEPNQRLQKAIGKINW